MKCIAIWYGETVLGATKSYCEVKECRKPRAVYWMICRSSGCQQELEVVLPVEGFERLEMELDRVWLDIHSGRIEPVEGLKRVAKILESIAGRELVVTVLEEEDFVRIEAV